MAPAASPATPAPTEIQAPDETRPEPEVCCCLAPAVGELIRPDGRTPLGIADSSAPILVAVASAAVSSSTLLRYALGICPSRDDSCPVGMDPIALLIASILEGMAVGIAVAKLEGIAVAKLEGRSAASEAKGAPADPSCWTRLLAAAGSCAEANGAARRRTSETFIVVEAEKRRDETRREGWPE